MYHCLIIGVITIVGSYRLKHGYLSLVNLQFVKLFTLGDSLCLELLSFLRFLCFYSDQSFNALNVDCIFKHFLVDLFIIYSIGPILEYSRLKYANSIGTQDSLILLKTLCYELSLKILDGTFSYVWLEECHYIPTAFCISEFCLTNVYMIYKFMYTLETRVRNT